MDHKGLLRLRQLETLNANPTWVNRDLYRLMYQEDLYITAYERIKSNPGNMTPGVDGSTLDGFSLETIRTTIDSMRDESFQFSPGRRINIPKANGKLRPLTIAPPREKVVQEVIRMILTAIYDGQVHPSFLDSSHGFRANRGTHTALREISLWKNVVWFVEGDIKGCFDNIDHHRLIELVKKRVSDSRFLNLLWKALKAGHMEFRNTFSINLSGTPQGSIVSPILANIYLHELDCFVTKLKTEYERGEKRRPNPFYRRVANQIDYWRKKGDIDKVRELEKARRQLSVYDVNDPNYVRIQYIRYADDWIMGVTGPKHLAEELKSRIRTFLADELKLELSADKTFIRHTRTEEAFFLGTVIRGQGGEANVSTVKRNGMTYRARTTGWNLNLLAPIGRIVDRLRAKGFCDHAGKPKHVSGWIHLDDGEILEQYNAVLWGILNYYSFAANYSRLGSVQSILQLSAAKTLAAKHRSGSIRRLFRVKGSALKFERKTDDTVHIASLRLNRDWRRQPGRFLVGANPTGDIYTQFTRKYTRSKLGMVCAICGSSDGVEMHHLRHVRKRNLKLKGINALMAQVNRKQIPVCKAHHREIHGGLYDGQGLSELSLTHMDWV